MVLLIRCGYKDFSLDQHRRKIFQFLPKIQLPMALICVTVKQKFFSYILKMLIKISSIPQFIGSRLVFTYTSFLFVTRAEKGILAKIQKFLVYIFLPT